MNETPITAETARIATDALWPSLHTPQWLWLLPVVLAVFGLLLLIARRGRERALSAFAAPRLLGSLLGSLSHTRRAFKSVLILVGAALVILAIARPQYGYRWSESRSRGIDIMFVLDTSRSMLATDIKPDRLQRAKLAILDFVDELQGDRIGLVAFAGDAFVQCPLTLDYHVFEQSLDAINTNIIPIGGTDFAKAITVAEDAFAKDNNHKIMIMLTDGEDLQGQGLKRAKEAAANGVTIFTVGVGTEEGSLIPVTDRFGRQDYLRDDSGQQVLTRLEADTLNGIAEVTGGFYVPLGSTGQGLQMVYHDGLQSFEKQELSSQMKREGIDRFQWPLGLAILLLAWEPLISNRRNGSSFLRLLFRSSKRAAPPTSASALAALLIPALGTLLLPALGMALAFAPQTTHASTTRNAEALFNKGDFPAAQAAFGQALEADPANIRARYNLANTLLADKQYEEAAKAYALVLADADIALQADAFYNLGLSHYGRGTQVFAGSDPVQTQTQSEQADAAASQAMQAGKQVLAEAARIAQMDGQRRPNQGPIQPAAQATAQQNEIPEIPQEAVRQAIQFAEQAKQASEAALESGTAFIEKAQAASGFWRRAEADFNSAAELSAGNVADARHNATQTQKSIDALSARISQTQRANQAHSTNADSLEKLIEELKKLLKEPPQNDQNQDQQNQQDQQQKQDNQQNQQNQDQSDSQSGQQDQNDSQSGEQNQQQNQDNQQSQQGEQQQNQQSVQQDNQQQGQEGQQSENNQQPEQQQGNDQSGKEDNKQQNDGQQQPNESGEQPQDQSGEKPQQEGGQNQPEQQQGDSPSQANQPEQNNQQDQQGQEQDRGAQQQPQGGDERQQGADSQDRGVQSTGDEQQPVDLTDEQAQQLAGGEQAAQDQSAGGQQEGAALQRAGAMSRQEAAGLIDSLQNSGRLLPLSGRGQQQQPQTRPTKNW